jgi:hypothetical protein
LAVGYKEQRMFDWGQFADTAGQLFGNKWLRAGVSVLILLIPAFYYGVPRLYDADASSFPFAAATRMRGVTIGLDPAKVQALDEGDGKTCSAHVAHLSHPENYGYEVDMWTVVPGGSRLRGTFDSDQSPGVIWQFEGTASPSAISIGFEHGDDASQAGSISLTKKTELPYATGWQIASDCVGNVKTVCPYIAAPADGVSIDTLKGSPFFKRYNTCKLLEDTDSSVRVAE